MTPNLSASEEIVDTGCELIYYPYFLAADAARLFANLQSELDWKKEYLTMFGKTIPSPRLMALYGEEGISYRYSGTEHKAATWTTALTQINQLITQVCGQPCNSVLANLYRNGEDSMGWHSDDEAELGVNPVVASISLGAERDFVLRNKSDTSEQHKFNLANGSLLIMRGQTQACWQHSLPKRKRCLEPRINLSFRQIYDE
ncbi:MAG: alkylated DNA repair dioxygenase AlkB [Porticoccus sp.]